MQKKIYIINGPNLNLLGTREPEKYGKRSLKDIKLLCYEKCKIHEFELNFFQSNIEGILIEEIHKNSKYDLFDSVRIALNEVIGAYAIVLINSENPNELIAARKSSPLVIGIGEEEFFCASDATPIIEYTKNVVYLEDGEIAQLSLKNGLKLKTIANQEKTPYIQELEMHLEALEKEAYEIEKKEIAEREKSILIQKEKQKNKKNVQKSKKELLEIQLTKLQQDLQNTEYLEKKEKIKKKIEKVMIMLY